MDSDVVGLQAAKTLAERAKSQGIAVTTLRPRTRDFNDDVSKLGVLGLIKNLRAQLGTDDAPCL
jgi:hypothetical protein